MLPPIQDLAHKIRPRQPWPGEMQVDSFDHRASVSLTLIMNGQRKKTMQPQLEKGGGEKGNCLSWEKSEHAHQV